MSTKKYLCRIFVEYCIYFINVNLKLNIVCFENAIKLTLSNLFLRRKYLFILLQY